MAYQTFLQEYMQIPIVTRVYTTACVITTLAVVSIRIKLRKLPTLTGTMPTTDQYILLPGKWS